MKLDARRPRPGTSGDGLFETTGQQHVSFGSRRAAKRSSRLTTTYRGETTIMKATTRFEGRLN